MNNELHPPHLPPESIRGRTASVITAASRIGRGLRGRSPAARIQQLRPGGHGRQAGPPAAFVRSLSEFLGDEMAPVRGERDLPWRWNMHPGAGVLTLPWPRHWAFKREGCSRRHRSSLVQGSRHRRLMAASRPSPWTGGSPPPRRRRAAGSNASAPYAACRARTPPRSRVGSRSRFCRRNGTGWSPRSRCSPHAGGVADRIPGPRSRGGCGICAMRRPGQLPGASEFP